MKLIVIGDKKSIEESKLKFTDLIQTVEGEKGLPEGNKAKNDNRGNLSFEEITFLHNYEDLGTKLLEEKAIVFDFFLDENIENFKIYKSKGNLIIFGNIPKLSLAEIRFFYGNYEPVLFGFNGMPGMTNRQFLEVTSSTEQHHTLLKEVCEALQTEYLLVDDRVGMVTPRIVAMIVNEAYFTVQEGTATKKDIDQAMKLGTNYPWGPFEWSLTLGIKNIYELLEALYDDTKDERYKICPLLRKEYLRSMTIKDQSYKP